MLFGTASHLLTNEAAIRCFRATAAALRPGGLFVLEMPSPEDLFDGVFALGDVWDATAPNGQKLLVEYGIEGDDFDSFTQVTRISGVLRAKRDFWNCCWIRFQHTSVLMYISCALQVTQRTVKISSLRSNGETDKLLLENVVAQRIFTSQEVDLLARLSGFEVVGVYGALDLEVGTESDDAYVSVLCLRKQE